MDEIDVQEAGRRHAAGEVVLVDVREDDEWRDVRVEGALHVPLMDVPERLPAIAADGRPIAWLCARGGRSANACSYAAAHGAPGVNVEGGMVAWERAGLPVVSG
jgi:rhodanese-related sulfurtransferase